MWNIDTNIYRKKEYVVSGTYVLRKPNIKFGSFDTHVEKQQETRGKQTNNSVKENSTH